MPGLVPGTRFDKRRKLWTSGQLAQLPHDQREIVMGTKLGSAKQARLFEALRQACDQQDAKAVAAAKLAIASLIARNS
jgi:hypothetical protein